MMYLFNFVSRMKPVKDFVNNDCPDLAFTQISATSSQLELRNIQQTTVCSSSTNTLSAGVMMDENPKNKVFDYWDHINTLADRRFPNDKNLQLEASQYVLEELATNDWQKVRAFKGEHFTGFITKTTLNLLSDFWRKKFGKECVNTWLKQQTEPLYKIAYQLLVKDKYSKRETIEILLMTEPTRERWKIQEVVSEVLSNCPIKGEIKEISLEGSEYSEYSDEENPFDNYTSLETQFEDESRHALLEMLLVFLRGKSNNNDTIAPEVKKLLAYLGQSVPLTEEDCLLLKLRFSSGLTLDKIAQLFDSTKSQNYKRIKKHIMLRLSNALKKLGFVEY
jgi:hypothetical protein